MNAPERYPFLPTTRWTLVERAGDGQLHVRRLALGELLRLYWPVLQAHLRRRGHLLPEKVDDLLQGFVCDKIVEQALLASCQREGGKFRSFLLTALDRYMVDQYRRQNAACRAPERADSGQEARLDLEPSPAGDPSDEFDAAWARQTVEDAVRRTQQECVDSGRPDVWQILQARLIAPVLEGAAITPYEELSCRLALPSATHAANLLTTGKRMFQRKLREVVRLYAADDAEVEQEIVEIQKCLGNRPATAR